MLNRGTRRGFLGAMAMLVLAGCGGPKNDGGSGAGMTSGPTTGGAGNASAGGKTIRAALVLDTGGVDDRSFNAAANAGIQRAKTELGLGESNIKVFETKVEADYKQNLTQFASQGYDVVFAVGFKMKPALEEIAPQFPNVKFAIIDADAPAGAANVVGLQFREEQGSFLAGYLAAAVSKTKTIGFVGGEQIDLIKKFEAGYRAGAKAADPNVKVLSAYTNDWNDQSKGSSQAQQEFGSGADIVFHAAGKAGLGVIEAAREKGVGFYAIGVDQDQDDVAPGRVLTSMVKRLDNAVFDTIKDVKDGKFTPGSRVFGLKEGGVGLSDMKNTKQDIPADVLARLDKVKQLISDGTLVVPTKLEDVAAFQPPKL